MKYEPLLSLSLAHDYEDDGRCRDLAVEPTPETQRLLANYRCLLKSRPDGIQIFAPAVDGTPLIAPAAGMQFGFLLRLREPEFSRFTDLRAFAGLAAPRYSNQRVSSGEVVPLTLDSRRDMAHERFVLPEASKALTLTLAGRPREHLTAQDFQIAGPQLRVTAYDAAAKQLTLDGSAATSGAAMAISYETTPRLLPGVLAEVLIDYGADTPKLSPDHGVYRIAFTAKQLHWVYYVISDNDGPCVISDARNGAGSPTFGSGVDLGSPDPADPIAAVLAAQYPTLRRMRFVSAQPIPLRRSTTRILQLRRDEDIVIDMLPTPAIHNLTPAVGSATTDCLFQIVTLIARPNTSSGG